VLFHLGVLDAPPRIQQPNQQAAREAAWAQVPPRLATTLRDYIAQVRLSLRPATMVRVEGVLREFACWVAAHAPDVGAVADLRRPHIESYKIHLAARPSARGGRLSKLSLAEHLGTLRTCFERLTEWAGEDVPTRVLVFSGDLPLRDDPLPRFLDDAAFTKLLQAARNDEDPFVRLCVEFLARTGMRKGEFLDLAVDSVVQIGAAYWLHVPVGKLRSDRYIPLHPQLKQLLDDWVATRPAGLAAPTCSSSTADASARTGSTAQSPRPPEPRASGTSPPTSCATPWPPRRSTGACRWRPSPPCWGTARCG
jgi:integrase